MIADAPDRTGLNPAVEIAVSVADLLFEPGDVGEQILADGTAGQREPIALSGAHLDQLPASGDKRMEVGLEIIGERARGGWHARGEGGEDRRIAAVGFLEGAERAGEIPDLAGIDDGDRQARGGEGGGDADFIATGGLEDDHARLEWQDVRDQRGPAGFVVGGLPRLTGGRRRGDVQRGFRDIDTDATRVGPGTPFGRSVDGARSALRLRVGSRATVRALPVDRQTRRPGYTTSWESPGESRATASVIERT